MEKAEIEEILENAFEPKDGKSWSFVPKEQHDLMMRSVVQHYKPIADKLGVGAGDVAQNTHAEMAALTFKISEQTGKSLEESTWTIQWVNTWSRALMNYLDEVAEAKKYLEGKKTN